MAPESSLAFQPLIGRSPALRRLQHVHGQTRPLSEDEAEHCRARAEEERRRANEAVYPAERAAHLEMAILYGKRVLTAERGPPLLARETPAMTESSSAGHAPISPRALVDQPHQIG